MLNHYDFIKQDNTYTAKITGIRPAIKAAYDKFFAKNDLYCIEVGVQEGANALIINQILKPKELLLIDIWEDAVFSVTEIYKKETYEIVKDRFKSFGNIKLLKGKSQDLLLTSKESAFDFIYIDGDHSTETCKQDIVNALRLVKDGGIVGGHDYGSQYVSEVKHSSMNGGGVNKAVHDLFDGKFVYAETSDWWVVVDNEMKQIRI